MINDNIFFLWHYSRVKVIFLPNKPHNHKSGKRKSEMRQIWSCSLLLIAQSLFNVVKACYHFNRYKTK